MAAQLRVMSLQALLGLLLDLHEQKWNTIESGSHSEQKTSAAQSAPFCPVLIVLPVSIQADRLDVVA